MAKLSGAIGVVPLGLLGLLSFTGEAHAYLDPGTGSMLLQAMIGSIAAGLVVGKIYWRRVKEFLSRGGSSAKSRGENLSAKEKS